MNFARRAASRKDGEFIYEHKEGLLEGSSVGCGVNLAFWCEAAEGAATVWRGGIPSFLPSVY